MSEGKGKGDFPNFSFASGDDWVRLSADLGQMGREIGEQVRKAMAEINFEGLGREIDRSMRDAAEEFRKAAAEWGQADCWKGPTRVQVDIHASDAAEEATRGGLEQRQKEPTATGETSPDERLMVLRLVAEGKITAEEAARLLEALGR
jgi:hypothetical protein